jgi:hypothetical protein
MLTRIRICNQKENGVSLCAIWIRMANDAKFIP